MTTFNLRTLKIRSGEQFHDERELELEPLELGGQRYLPVPEKVPAGLAITRASTGTVFELDFRVRLHGPCVRCLNDAVLDLPISGREYQATEPAGDEGSSARPTSRTTGSTSRHGRATRSRWRCRDRSSAGPTAPASARSAARTSTASRTTTASPSPTPVGPRLPS